MARTLVTGGAGFVGSNLTEALLRHGHQVRVLDNFSTGRRENLVFQETYPGLQIVEGDICDSNVCRAGMEDVQFVFHEAAIASVQRSVEDPLGSHAVNISGTLNLLLAGRDAAIKRFIFASSAAVYGGSPILPKKEDMPVEPLSPYALHKFIGEEYCRLFSRLYGLETISLRYFNIFGPKQDPSSVYSGVISKFIYALLGDRPPVIFGDGEQSRDFVYIDDVVRANLFAMSAELPPGFQGEPINIASGKRTSIKELLDSLKNIIGSVRQPIYQEPQRGDIKHSLADIRVARKALDYQPETEIVKGLEKTVGFVKKGLTARGMKP